jgi:hypothetical protein
MPTSKLLDRVRVQWEALGLEGETLEKGIVGGTGFLWRGNLVCGVVGDELLVRLGKEGGAHVRLAKADAATTGGVEHPQVHRMMMGGRESKTWFLVPADVVRTKIPLRTWIESAVAFAATLPEA